MRKPQLRRRLRLVLQEIALRSVLEFRLSFRFVFFATVLPRAHGRRDQLIILILIPKVKRLIRQIILLLPGILFPLLPLLVISGVFVHVDNILPALQFGAGVFVILELLDLGSFDICGLGVPLILHIMLPSLCHFLIEIFHCLHR